MSTNYKIREVHIFLAEGFEVVADVASVGDIKQLIADLRAEGHKPVSDVQSPKKGQQVDDHKKLDSHSPLSKIELRAGIVEGQLSGQSILAIKADLPQLLRPNSFKSTTDALLALLFSIESALGRQSIPYDDFKTIFQSQGIKSGSPLPLLLSNLKLDNYINKKLYDSDREISLSPKGDKKAAEVLRALVGGASSVGKT